MTTSLTYNFFDIPSPMIFKISSPIDHPAIINPPPSSVFPDPSQVLQQSNIRQRNLTLEPSPSGIPQIFIPSISIVTPDPPSSALSASITPQTTFHSKLKSQFLKHSYPGSSCLPVLLGLNHTSLGSLLYLDSGNRTGSPFDYHLDNLSDSTQRS